MRVAVDKIDASKRDTDGAEEELEDTKNVVPCPDGRIDSGRRCLLWVSEK